MVDFVALRLKGKEKAKADIAKGVAYPILKDGEEPEKNDLPLSQVINLMEDCSDKLTRWESNFIQSCYEWLRAKAGNRLSIKQATILEELVVKHL